MGMEVLGQMMTNTAASESVSEKEVCEKCGENRCMEVTILGRKHIVRKQCRCEREESQKRREEDERKQKQIRLNRLKESSMMDREFKSCTFENFIRNNYNRQIYKMAMRYCENWPKMKEKNIGFMLWGNPGNGKTYIASCIANRLLSQMVPVIAISSIGILSRIKQTYNSFGKEGEVQVIGMLKNASLLILDDLGAENDTQWSREKLYEIVDSRYRQAKPMIVTTNLTPDQLKRKLTSGDGVTRTYDRLIEMCTPVELKGPSRRAEAAADKMEVIRELLK